MGKVHRDAGYDPNKETEIRGKSANEPAKPQNDDEMVLTPGGWRQRSQVHFIEKGHQISGKEGKLKIIETATGKEVKDLGEKSTKDRFKTPPLVKTKGLSPAIADIGWIENSGWTNNSGSPIVYYSTKWIVPPAPASDDDQTVFLFNGLQQTSSGPYILQPVLQWGTSAAGGGKYWSIANWYVDGQGSTAITPAGGVIKVNSGDELQGIMTMTGKSGSEFSYKSSFAGYPDGDIDASNIDELGWACETLECYGSDYTKPLTQCSDYPDTVLTAFYDIEIKVGDSVDTGTEASIDWDAQTNFTTCGQQCVIVSNDSPGGIVYLYYETVAQNLYFVADKSTFGRDEVSDFPNYPDAFWLELEGFTIEQLASAVPVLSGQFESFPGITISSGGSADFQFPGDLNTPQRIRFPFNINFGATSLAAFPTTGNPALQEILNATITVAGTILNASTLFELIAGADPYFTNINPAQDNVFYLSQDLRVFTVTPGINNAPVGNIGTPPQLNSGNVSAQDPAAGFQYAQDLINYLNTNYNNPAGTDPFALLPDQAGAFNGDSSVSPYTYDFSNIFSPKIYSNYNFAIARVRLKGSSGSQTQNVKVFFRLWTTQSPDTDYQPSTTYLSNLDSNGLPNSPLVDSAKDTIPFFATSNYPGTNDYTSGGVNNRTITLSGSSTWAYFGCFLNVYDGGNIIDGQQIQYWLNGTHHCIVAQIAYDDAPIINSNGITLSPENSDKMAQRNLQVTHSDNPGNSATHRIPQTFDIRPSQPTLELTGTFLDYPDELMIDWGNTPIGSTANIFWPQVNSSDVIQLASQLYPISQLSAVDNNTIQCEVVKGVTYIPIPVGSGQNFSGLFTVNLPATVVKGQEFNITVRRITTRQNPNQRINQGLGDATFIGNKGARNWRYVTGTFQVKIPVSTKEFILFPEENTLAILKWRLNAMLPGYRWFPVLQKYISYVAARVDGMGGNSASIKPSLRGVPVKRQGEEKERPSYTGKICEIIFNCFGDFEGFVLETCDCQEIFKSCEKAIGEICLRACKDRLPVSIHVNQKKKITKIIIHC